jgi:hypothetical protein
MKTKKFVFSYTLIKILDVCHSYSLRPGIIMKEIRETKEREAE